MGKAHDYAFAIRDPVKGLATKRSDEKNTKAQEVSKLAIAIDKSSDAKDQQATEANAKQLSARIRNWKLP